MKRFDLRCFFQRALIVVALVGIVLSIFGRIFFPEALAFIGEKLGGNLWTVGVVLAVMVGYWLVSLLKLFQGRK